jgi:hypothetical protein
MTQYQPYKPQYREKGLTPIQYPTRTVPAGTNPAPFAMAFSSKRRQTQSAVPPVSQVPYAELGTKATQLLNVGNNFDTNWGAVESIPTQVFETVEDTSPIDTSQPMIDNNDFIVPSPQAFLPARQMAPMRPPVRVEEPPPSMPNVGDYVLLLGGEVVAIGDTRQIQDAAWSLLTESESLPNDLVVMKRVEMNIGVFLSE